MTIQIINLIWLRIISLFLLLHRFEELGKLRDWLIKKFSHKIFENGQDSCKIGRIQGEQAL